MFGRLAMAALAVFLTAGIAAASPDRPAAYPDRPAASPDRSVASPGGPVAAPGKPNASPDRSAASPGGPVASPDRSAASAGKPIASPDRSAASPSPVTNEPPTIAEILESFSRIPYRRDGAVSDDGRWTLWASPETTLPSPGFNCSGFVVAAVRKLTGLAVPLTLASFDRDDDSGPDSPLGADWDFGLDVLLNLAPPTSLRPQPLGPKISEGPNGRPVGWGTDVHGEEFERILGSLEKGRFHLVAISKPDRRFKGGLSFYHVALIHADEEGHAWIHQATAKAGVHRIDISTPAGLATIRRYFPPIQGGGRRAIFATPSPEWIAAQTTTYELVLAARAAEAERLRAEAEAPPEAAIAVIEAPRTEAIRAETPQAEATRTEAPQAEAPKAEASRAGVIRAESPQAEATRAGASRAGVIPAESPPAEAPQAEPPKTEAPKAEAPKAETTRAEAPKAVAPEPASPPVEPPQAETAEIGLPETPEPAAALTGFPLEPDLASEIGPASESGSALESGEPRRLAALAGDNPWTAAARLGPGPTPEEAIEPVPEEGFIVLGLTGPGESAPVSQATAAVEAALAPVSQAPAAMEVALAPAPAPAIEAPAAVEAAPATPQTAKAVIQAPAAVEAPAAPPQTARAVILPADLPDGLELEGGLKIFTLKR